MDSIYSIKLKIIMLSLGLILITQINAQNSPGPIPFAEAKKAMKASSNKAIYIDSLKQVYKNKWGLDFSYGQRFIAESGKSTVLDTVTFADFTSTRAVYGIGFGYYVTKKLKFGTGMDFTILPRKQEITSINFGGPNGISAEGSGNGGALFNIFLGSTYYLSKRNTRPYIGVEVGLMQLIARGGTGSFTLSTGMDEEVNELNSRLFSAQTLLGISHRVSPVFLIDYNVGYTKTTKTEPIGGITSVTGFTSTLTLQFILNSGKK